MDEDSVELIIRLLRAAMGEKYTYFDGDPDKIAKFELPAIAVEMVNDQTTGGTWGEDDVSDAVLIKIIFDKSDDWSDKREELNLTHKKVRKAIGARDAQGFYLPDTIKGALRPELFGERRIAKDVSVDYGFLERPESVFTSEGHVTVRLEYSVTVPPPTN